MPRLTARCVKLSSKRTTHRAGGAGYSVGSDDKIDFRPDSSLPIHLFHWRLPKAKHHEISHESRANTLKLHSSRLNLTGFDGDSTRGWGPDLSRKQTDTLFRFGVDVEWEGYLSRSDQGVGISVLQDQSQLSHISIAILNTTSSDNSTTTRRLAPHVRFSGRLDDTVPCPGEHALPR